MLSDFLVGAGSALGDAAPVVGGIGQKMNEKGLMRAVAKLHALGLNPHTEQAEVDAAIAEIGANQNIGVSPDLRKIGRDTITRVRDTRTKAEQRKEDVAARKLKDERDYGHQKEMREIAKQRLSQAGDFTDAQLAAIREKGIDQEWFTGISAEDYVNFVTGKGPLSPEVPEQPVDITAAIGATSGAKPAFNEDDVQWMLNNTFAGEPTHRMRQNAEITLKSKESTPEMVEAARRFLAGATPPPPAADKPRGGPGSPTATSLFDIQSGGLQASEKLTLAGMSDAQVINFLEDSIEIGQQRFNDARASGDDTDALADEIGRFIKELDRINSLSIGSVDMIPILQERLRLSREEFNALRKKRDHAGATRVADRVGRLIREIRRLKSSDTSPRGINSDMSPSGVR